MQDEILIISSYPNNENIKDGMIRRIQEIDQKLIKSYKRIYLDISFRKNLKKKIKIEKNLEVYRLNFFKDYFFILKKLNQAKIIYIHSLYNYLKIRFILRLKKNKIILDTHGIVPEENKFEGKLIYSLLLNYYEKILFRNLNKIIFVTNQMKIFYEKKYPNYMKKINSEVIPILNEKTIENKNEISSDLREKIKNKIVIIYSGNLQKWQNIDSMLTIIAKNLKKDLFYIILTGQKNEMERKFIEKNIPTNFYFIDSVLPSELSKYYKVANYGFVLREDHILNRVANPTKLGEYLDYGIIPIVKLEEIGDYMELGYEYITINQFNLELKKIKSYQNIELMKTYREQIKKIDFLKFIEE